MMSGMGICRWRRRGGGFMTAVRAISAMVHLSRRGRGFMAAMSAMIHLGRGSRGFVAIVPTMCAMIHLRRGGRGGQHRAEREEDGPAHAGRTVTICIMPACM